MPAVSKAQQRFFGMVRALQKGKLSNPSAGLRRAAESMTAEDAGDFAKTKHDGLPDKVAIMLCEDLPMSVKEAVFSCASKSEQLDILSRMLANVEEERREV